MTKFAAAVAAMILLPTSAWADGAITGTVKSKNTGEPVSFAVIQLIDAKTDKPLTIGTNADDDGNFVLENVPDGNYMVRISNLGSIPQERPVKIEGADIALGIVRLADDTKMLDEVVVEGIKGQMRFELDKKVFNVDASIAAAGASASELLESIPSVEVNQDGEVSLRGNSSVTVWLNGKESGLTADNRAQILEQIPAETIEKIEVITNPSAKYSPEGTAGIINIVLKKDRRGGYFGSAELGGNTRGGANASFNINLNYSKWEAFAGLGLRMRHNRGSSFSYRDYSNGDYLNSDGLSRNHGDNIFFRLGATYHITDKDDVYVSGFGMFGHRWGKNNTLYESNLPSQWMTNENLSRNRGNNRGGHVEIGYTHKFRENHTLDFTGSYNRWGGPNWSSYFQSQTYADGTHEDVYQEQDQSIGLTNWEAKVDYVNQLNSWLKLEAGFDGEYSREDTPVTTREGTSAADMQINPALYNRFIYDNDISALYTTLGGKVGNFSFSAGVRAEMWQIRTRSVEWGQEAQDVPQYKRNNFALFPSAFLSYSLPKDNEIQINYTRRIRRPWGGQLNSFRDISNPTNISYGNPELEPEYSNSFELNYLKSWTFHMISVSAYLRTSDNMMNRLSYLDGDILYSTWGNVSSQTNMGCEIVVKNSFFRQRLDLTTTANLYNSHMKAWSMVFENEGREFPISGAARNDFAWDIRCMASVRLPWGLSFQATGRYNSKRLTAQGSMQPGWSVDAGIRKVAGNWSFSLNCRDIFDSRKFHTYTFGDNYSQEDMRRHGGRRLQLSIKYSFGNMKAKMNKRTMMNSGEPMDGSGYSDTGLQ